MGLEAYELLLEVVAIWNAEDADSFIISGELTGILGRLFNTDTAGNFTIAFNFSLVDLMATWPFLHAFPSSLGLFHNLSFACLSRNMMGTNRFLHQLPQFISTIFKGRSNPHPPCR
jgi:hypothetical protein